MAERYDVLVKVVSQKGTCAREHKVGDEWVIGGKTPEGICIEAFQTLIPHMQALMFGGSFPWGTDPHVTIEACPDPANPVVFELSRVPK